MTAGEILVGQLFALPGKRKKYLKLRNYGQPLPATDHTGTVQHDKDGNLVFVESITVRTMSGKKLDMPKNQEVIVLV